MIVMPSSISGHTSLFRLSLKGHINSGCTVDVKVGQVGTPDAAAVPFEVVSVAKVKLETPDCELETVRCLWYLATEKGRELGEVLVGIESSRKILTSVSVRIGYQI